jgi:3-dehydroquinate synthase
MESNLNYSYKFSQEINFSVLFTEGFSDTDSNFSEEIKTYFRHAERIIAFFDQNVFQLYGATVLKNIKKFNKNVIVATISINEDTKNLENLISVLSTFEHHSISRRSDPVIAIGGGVLLDVIGLACSLYRRGIPFYKVPTTLLGMVDACLGAKTAINLFGRRNRLGTYSPSVAAFIDKGFLRSLPKNIITEGTGEILKIGVIKDVRIIQMLLAHGEEIYEKNYVCNAGEAIMHLAITGMMDSLKDNLWEKNLKRDVDFGHSFSQNVEMHSLKLSDEKLSHGEAVALDVLLSCHISLLRNYITELDLVKVITIMKIFNLRVKHPLFNSFETVLEGFVDIQKHRNNNQHLPVPRPIGTTDFIEDLTHDELKKACLSMERWA